MGGARAYYGDGGEDAYDDGGESERIYEGMVSKLRVSCYVAIIAMLLILMCTCYAARGRRSAPRIPPDATNLMLVMFPVLAGFCIGIGTFGGYLVWPPVVVGALVALIFGNFVMWAPAQSSSS